MGSVIDFDARRRRPASGGGQHSPPPRFVTCTQCGERHPIIRLRGGEERCVTAFADGPRWFCRNRGCRRSWLERS